MLESGTFVLIANASDICIERQKTVKASQLRRLFTVYMLYIDVIEAMQRQVA